MTAPDSTLQRRSTVLMLIAALLILAAWLVWHYVTEHGTHGGVAARSSVTQGAAAPHLQALDKPLWHDLSPAQQAGLAPLQNEWDGLDGARKRKWLEMSRRFGSMNAAEQARVHERMREWIRLTPEQRELARENYNKARKLAPGEKAATWESYQQLSADQKQRLAQTATHKKAPPKAEAASKAGTFIAAPISCPAGSTRRGATCIAQESTDSTPGAPLAAPAPALTQPSPAPLPPAGLAPAPAPTPASALGAPALPALTPSTSAAPVPSNANG